MLVQTSTYVVRSIWTCTRTQAPSASQLALLVLQGLGLKAIMTTCRRPGTFAYGLVLLAATLTVSGCASLPQDQPVYEVLDQETGITIMRLGKPLEFTVGEGQGPTGDPFAYAGVFQTNRMGARAEFLWLAVPVDGTLASGPTLEIDGVAVTLASSTNNPSIAGLKSGPYTSPAPWARQFWYAVDAATIERLARATSMTIRTADTGGTWTFMPPVDARRRLMAYFETR